MDIKELRRRFDLRELIPKGVDYRETPKCRCQRCLWHEEQNPSLLVYQDGYFCKACGVRGDVVDWTQFSEGFSFGEALAFLSKQAGEIIWTPPVVVKAPPLPVDVALDYHFAITQRELAYYEHRGLIKETIVKFQLGYGNPPGKETGYFTLPVYKGEDLVNVKFRRDDTCPSCGNFDAKEEHGLLTCLCGETWNADGPKYLGIKDRNMPRLFNSRFLFAHKYGLREHGIMSEVVITEGEYDAMLATQAGFKGICSTGGAASFQKEWGQLLKPYRDVFLVYDNDEAGRRGREIVHSLVPQAVDIHIPLDFEKADLTDFISSTSEEDFRGLVRFAKTRARAKRQFAVLKEIRCKR